MNKSLKTIIWIVVVALVVWGIYSVSTQEKVSIEKSEEPIKIGAILPLSGKIAQYAEEARQGIEMALEEENDIKIKVVYEDSKSDAKEGVSAYKRLMTTGLSTLITGASPISLAISPLANQDKILQMGVFSSVSDYTSPNDFTFRVTARSEVENEKMANWVINHGYKKFAMLYSNSDWGESHRSFIKLEIEKLGGEVIIEENFLDENNDFRTQLVKIKNKNPEAIFLLSRAKNAGTILRQAEELGVQKQFFGVRAVESQELLDVAKEAAEGIIYPYSFNPDSDNQRIRDFVSKYRKKYGEMPTTYVAEGYDAANLLIKSIKNCGGDDSQCMKNDLLNTKDYTGILGNITFDENGDVFYNHFIKTVKNGEFVPYEE